MDRRRRVLLLALGMGCAPAALRAQPARRYRLGILAIDSLDTFLDGQRDGLLAALASLGIVVGRNLDLEERVAKTPEELEKHAADLAKARLDAIVTEGTPSTLALQAATKTVPIITHVGDPVAAGFAKSLHRPGGNITGLSQNRPAAARKLVEFLNALRPGTKALATAYEEPLPAPQLVLGAFSDAAREAGMRVVAYSYAAGGFGALVRQLKHRKLGVVYTFGLRKGDAQEAIREGIVVLAPFARDVENGALLALENDPAGDPAVLASLVEKVLRGANPAQLPFVEATRFRATLNRKTAAALGLQVPGDVMLRIDRIIE